MVKYFHTDPLVAAWMAKHFGMKFLIRTGLKYKACPIEVDSTIRGMLHDAIDYIEWKYYIHPDSLHLLDELTDAKQIALKELGIWPESEEE